MNRIVLVSLFVPAIALSDPRHVLVLKSEGGDPAIRAKVDAQIVKLAKNLDGNVEAGEINLTDAAVAAGCAATDPACKDEVLATLGVDEIVATTVTSGPVETKVTVRRLAKGVPPQSTQSTIPSNQPIDARLATEVGPMFGVKPTPTIAPTPPSPPTPPAKPPTPDNPTVPPPTTAAPTRTAQVGVTAAPDGTIAQPPAPEGDNRKLALTGIIGGGTLVVLGVVMWAEASSTQNDINNAPIKTVNDFHHLQDLENQGDAYALAGNLMFFGGLALGAVSGYFYVRDHRRAHERGTARIAPTVFRHGAGLTLTFGGAR
jgi:hypothetical protein